MEQFWVTVLTSGFTASLFGFVQFLISRHDTKKQAKDEKLELIMKSLIGMGHDRIFYLASEYIKHGSITRSEYENLYEFLYCPYHNLGGNGSAERLMREIEKLPIKEGE